MSQIYDAFISYAREDHNIAGRIYRDLNASGLAVWLDSESLKPGEIWRQAIPGAIRASTFFVTLLSSQSLSKRGYFQKELNLAFKVVQELPYGSIFVIPVRIDDCQVSDPRIRNYNFLDLFRSYDDALSKLIKALSSGKDSPGKSEAKTGNRQSDSNDQCPKCGAEVGSGKHTCPVCDEALAPPNVRFALRHRSALQRRYRDALQRARVSGYYTVLDAFERMAGKTVVVITTSYNRALRMLTPGDSHFRSFYQLASAERAERIAKDYLFPEYAQDLGFGVLSPDGVGLAEYGDVSIVLHEDAVIRRATVSETNSFDIVNREFVGSDALAGFASVLSDRHLLAVAKSAHLINANTTERELRDLILPVSKTRATIDCMEVQIYGSIDRQAIQSIQIRRTDRNEDSMIMQELLRRKAQQQGISLSAD